MTVTTIRAQITEDGHPLQGAEVLIRWDGPDIRSTLVDVRVEPLGRVGTGRWVPVQLLDAYLGLPTSDEAA
jgi:hypothetical protein